MSAHITAASAVVRSSRVVILRSLCQVTSLMSSLRSLPRWGLPADPKGRDTGCPAVISAGSCAARSPTPDPDGRAQPTPDPASSLLPAAWAGSASVGQCRPLSASVGSRRSACHPAATSLPFHLLHSHRACRRRHSDPRSNTAPNGVKQAAKLASSSVTPHGHDETISSPSGIHTRDYAPFIIPSPMSIPSSPSHPLKVSHQVAHPTWLPALSPRSLLLLPMASPHSASSHSFDRASG